ncbi:MAG: DUF5655 domain-containing protein [Gemmatimonadota bacterium]|nr:DUF5655 domain-containing protein [Gemmatimonadota bacterium]
MPTPEEMAATMRENALEKTGRVVEDWFGVLSATGLERHGELVKHLKTEHGVTHGFANLIVHEFRAGTSGGTNGAGNDPIAAHYSGKKEHLRPVYDAIMERVNALGDDVEVAPKKAYVSLRRSKQFACVGPATNSALEVGLNMKGHPTTSRLLEGKGMVTHRVRLGSVDEVDDELVGWIREAYAAS